MPTQRRADARSARLCRQVGRILELSLFDHTPDWVPWLTIVDVLPDPNLARLRVIVGFDPERVSHDCLIATREHLQRIRPELREEVAAGIRRKRTPDLCFQLLPL